MKGKVIAYTDSTITIVNDNNDRVTFKLAKHCMVIDRAKKEPVPMDAIFHKRVDVVASTRKFKYTKDGANDTSLTYEGTSRIAKTIYMN